MSSVASSVTSSVTSSVASASVFVNDVDRDDIFGCLRKWRSRSSIRDFTFTENDVFPSNMLKNGGSFTVVNLFVMIGKNIMVGTGVGISDVNAKIAALEDFLRKYPSVLETNDKDESEDDISEGEYYGPRRRTSSPRGRSREGRPSEKKKEKKKEKKEKRGNYYDAEYYYDMGYTDTCIASGFDCGCPVCEGYLEKEREKKEVKKERIESPKRRRSPSSREGSRSPDRKSRSPSKERLV